MATHVAGDAAATVVAVPEARPYLTIGMPVHNGERHIRRALHSLLTQDYPALKVVISDNASTDATLSIAQEFALRDPRVRVEVNERNTGPVNNFRRLVKNAETPYFMWAACDDVWLPTFVSRMVDELDEHPDAGVAFCAVDLIDDDGVPQGRITFDGGDDPNRRSYWEMAHGLVTPRKYNLWVYGLFRTPVLRAAIDPLPDMRAWDRWLILVVALGVRLRYVSQVLHRRTVRPPTHVPSLREGVSTSARTIVIVARMILTSPLVPWNRRLWAPLVLGHCALFLGKGLLVDRARELHRRFGPRLRFGAGR
jgi:glycosyltransferase involved in cell wall biosynthesis